MNTKPILFSTPMVQAILNGTKTQTRRVVKPQPESSFVWTKHKECKEEADYMCPYGQVGDVLWVRETMILNKNSNTYWPVADGYKKHFQYEKVVPSIHVPKEACRLFLKIKDIRVERLQDISEEDAKSEGIEKVNDNQFLAYRSYVIPRDKCTGIFPITSFQTLWQSINGEQSWNENPWVWVIEFERIEKPENF